MGKFTLDMLREGMLVVYRDGSFRKVMSYRGELVVNSFRGFNRVSIYNQDLTTGEEESCTDIVKVYAPKNYSPSTLFNFGISEHNLIWEREEAPIELTINEIAEKFGVNPRQIKIIK